MENASMHPPEKGLTGNFTTKEGIIVDCTRKYGEKKRKKKQSHQSERHGTKTTQSYHEFTVVLAI